MNICDNRECPLYGYPTPHADYPDQDVVLDNFQAGEREADVLIDAHRTTPVQHTYFVTATLQVLVEEENVADALITVKDALNTVIEQSRYPQDPMNGAVIDGVEELP